MLEQLYLEQDRSSLMDIWNKFEWIMKNRNFKIKILYFFHIISRSIRLSDCYRRHFIKVWDGIYLKILLQRYNDPVCLWVHQESSRLNKMMMILESFSDHFKLNPVERLWQQTSKSIEPLMINSHTLGRVNHTNLTKFDKNSTLTKGFVEKG